MTPRAKALAVVYALVRVPVTVVDRSVVQQLPAGCRPRTVFDHGLGVADHWAGLILADDAVAASGRARIDQAGRYPGGGRDLSAGRGARTSELTGKPYATTRSATT